MDGPHNFDLSSKGALGTWSLKGIKMDYPSTSDLLMATQPLYLLSSPVPTKSLWPLHSLHELLGLPGHPSISLQPRNGRPASPKSTWLRRLRSCYTSGHSFTGIPTALINMSGEFTAMGRHCAIPRLTTDTYHICLISVHQPASQTKWTTPTNKPKNTKSFPCHLHWVKGGPQKQVNCKDIGTILPSRVL